VGGFSALQDGRLSRINWENCGGRCFRVGRLWILLLNQKKIMIVLMVNQMTAMTDAQFYEQKNNAETFG
jgi:hypothetical protein